MSSTSPKLSALGKVQIGGETVFNQTSSSLADVRVVEVDRSGLTEEAIIDEFQRQDFYEVERILGARLGTVTTTHYLQGYSSTLPTGAPSHTTPDASTDGFQTLFGAVAAAFGDHMSGGYQNGIDLSASPSTTTHFKQSDAAGTYAAGGFAVGQAVAFEKADGTYEVAWIKEVDDTGDPNIMDSLQTMSEAPPSTASDTLWGSYVAVMASGTPYIDATPSSFTLKIFGHDADDVTTCTGCMPTGLTIDYEMGQLPKLTITWGVADWSEAGSGGAPSVITWAFPAAEPNHGASVIWGTTVGTTQIVQNLKFDLGLTMNALKDYNATNGVGGWFSVNIQPRVTYSVLRDESAEPTDWAALTGKPFTATFGTQPGKMTSLLIADALIGEFPTWEDGDGAIMSPITLYPNYYNGDTGSSTAADTLCRLAWL